MSRKVRVEGAVYERNYVYNFHFHLIWVTKYRQPAFTTPELVEEMKGIILHVCRLANVHLEEMEVMPDHVHLLISFQPKYAPADVVKRIKGSSAYSFLKAHPEIKRSKFWGGHLWSHSYHMSALGNMSRETIVKYIQNQYTKANPHSSPD